MDDQSLEEKNNWLSTSRISLSLAQLALLVYWMSSHSQGTSCQTAADIRLAVPDISLFFMCGFY